MRLSPGLSAIPSWKTFSPAHDTFAVVVAPVDVTSVVIDPVASRAGFQCETRTTPAISVGCMTEGLPPTKSMLIARGVAPPRAAFLPEFRSMAQSSNRMKTPHASSMAAWLISRAF